MTVSDGVVLPAGDYSFTSFRLNASSAVHRPIVFERAGISAAITRGDTTTSRLGLTVKLKGYATLAFDANLVRGRMPTGNFSENVYQLKADIFLSPDLGFMNYIQYDDMSRHARLERPAALADHARQRDLSGL